MFKIFSFLSLHCIFFAAAFFYFLLFTPYFSSSIPISTFLSHFSFFISFRVWFLFFFLLYERCKTTVQSFFPFLIVCSCFLHLECFPFVFHNFFLSFKISLLKNVLRKAVFFPLPPHDLLQFGFSCCLLPRC